jgi:hypothetical protein
MLVLRIEIQPLSREAQPNFDTLTAVSFRKKTILKKENECLMYEMANVWS